MSNQTMMMHNRIWQKREQSYLDTIQKYTETEVNKFTEMLAWLMETLETEMTDVLGQIYMESGMGSKAAGQFFTPYHLSELCAILALPDCDCDRTECHIAKESGYFDFVLTYKDSFGEPEEELMTVDDLNDFLEEHGYDEYKVIGITIRPVIYPNTMFLTEKDAREHLEKNYYHYSDDAHTYCMCAWRSPVVERLWKILRETKW